MSAEIVLTKLENEDEQFTIDEPITTPPPLVSSFYWQNHRGTKYKVFIPTEDKEVYWNFEEYDKKDINLDTIDENWRAAKKCVQIAVSDALGKDELVNDKMNKMLSELCKNIESKKSRKPIKIRDEENLKFYRIFKYSVDEILQIDMKDRFKHAKFFYEFDVSPHDEDQELNDAINDAFEIIAKRFQKSKRRKLLCYSGRNNHYFN